MASNTDQSSVFTVLASALAVSLIAAAGISYLQSGNDAGSDSSSPALAAISQAVPLHAQAALRGEPGGFESLQSDLNRLASIGDGASGAAWDELERHARAILERQNDVESVTGAARLVNDRMPQLLNASDALLDQSGATAVIQELQRRGAAVQTTLAGLAASAAGGNAAAAEAVAE